MAIVSQCKTPEGFRDGHKAAYCPGFGLHGDERLVHGRLAAFCIAHHRVPKRRAVRGPLDSFARPKAVLC